MTDSSVEIQGRHLKLVEPAKRCCIRQRDSPRSRSSTTTRGSRPRILPHLEGRALTRKRYPDGVDGEPFFEKNAPMHRPDWVKTAPIWSEP